MREIFNYMVRSITVDGVIGETGWRGGKRIKFNLPNEGIFKRVDDRDGDHVAKVNGQYIEIGYVGEVELDEDNEVVKFTIKP